MVERYHLPNGVHAGVGPTGGLGACELSGHTLEGFFEDRLNRKAVFLGLPAAVAGALVGDHQAANPGVNLLSTSTLRQFQLSRELKFHHHAEHDVVAGEVHARTFAEIIDKRGLVLDKQVGVLDADTLFEVHGGVWVYYI